MMATKNPADAVTSDGAIAQELEVPMHPQSITIPLTQGEVAIIDEEDYERVSRFSWYVMRTKWNAYACTWLPETKRAMYLHRFILDAPKGVPVDHKNGLSLDCRKENLRLCTTRQNAQNSRLRKDNTSGYKGVAWDNQKRRWYANITLDGKFHSLGHFDDPVEAARLYDRAAREAFGAFARLNFPDDT